MKPKPKIISIKCPNCQKRYMILKTKRIVGARNMFIEKEWVCPVCPVWVWSDHWFDEFSQFEHLIKREGDYP